MSDYLDEIIEERKRIEKSGIGFEKRLKEFDSRFNGDNKNNRTIFYNVFYPETCSKPINEHEHKWLKP